MSYHLNRVVAHFYLSPGSRSFTPGLVVSHPRARNLSSPGSQSLTPGLASTYLWAQTPADHFIMQAIRTAGLDLQTPFHTFSS